ncbi:MAG: Pyridoxine 5'-phosphate synthase [candidate division TA06 bacterium ADurb.Bin131]|jgi:pyridoxine 5-phosphate synthase|uniref:Pyridoxine 5'-phosphate synthase n=1 Tax=candidate division TA06 bacterium ADurb.Bin131 TaxID=1852827 RepID=A0A1V6C442_UNCT6|nr:MAG: Pyridoxine 5'-phosphate synthase [candidate division TA06 bacterium ADurb.Bin131]HOC02070.1 pyridoxine 5'-phosphate synthase [bacterium]HQL65166.1 pyridoxine 5'-phosphate synthase [bacterium]
MGGLGVNIDHIATLRQARRGRFPEPVFAAGICEIAGCDSIVCHLREDRRHIQDKDVYLLKSSVRRLNLEMAVNEGIVKIALDVCPAQVTLVPEKREELTTEGGLDVSGNLDRIKQTTDRFHEKGIVVSLFIDPDFKQIDASKSVGADAIEIHTGKYADIFEEHQESLWYEEYEKIVKSAEYAMSTGLKVHAGHGLDYRNIYPILSIQQIQEFNIGYSIICKAVFIGLHNAVKEMVSIIKHLPK